MKRIKMAMILVASNGFLSAIALGCWFPAQVRAEAPTPRSGCWSREIVMRPLTDPQANAPIQGRVIAIEHGPNQQVAKKEMATWVRLQTPSGEQKLIYLGSVRSLRQRNLKLQTNDSIEIQGVPMPKAKQPTIVANTVKKGDRTWKLNSFTNKQVAARSCKFTG
jgi:hypothetical protein